MKKWKGYMLIGLTFLSGCMHSSATKDDDVAAIVRGEEIMVGDLRLLYPDDVIAEMVDGTVKAKLAEQEVNKMNKDISKEAKEIEQSYGVYPEDDVNSPEAESIRTFANPQAEKLDMDPHVYYEKYAKASAEMTAYINTYVSVILGGLEDDEFGIEEYNHHANEMLDELVELNSDAIEILIK